MRRGEVFDVAVDEQGRTGRFLVVSSSEWNEGAPPQCIPLLRAHNVPEVLPFVVRTSEVDPVTGVLDIGRLGPIDPAAFVDEPVGMLTGATMAKVSDCLRILYEL